MYREPEFITDPDSSTVECKGPNCYTQVPVHRFRLCRRCFKLLPQELRARFGRLKAHVARNEPTATRLYAFSWQQAMRYLWWLSDRSCHRPAGLGGPLDPGVELDKRAYYPTDVDP